MVGWKAASSVIVVSRTTGRVLVMKRGASAKFMPNALVFPGGVVTASDEKSGHPMKSAAARELFEETGLLLGQQESAATSEELEKMQEYTRRDPEQFKMVCSSVPINELLEWNTWLTPSTYNRRYMTSFYIAQLDGEPEIRMCEREMSHYYWIEPDNCLEQARKGEVILPPPQVYELTRLSQTPCEKIKERISSMHVICPQIITWQDRSYITSVLPGDHLYIDADNFHQPERTMALDAVRVDPCEPTHRMEYCTKPLYAKCKIYMHNMLPKYRKIFHQFTTNSKKLEG